MPPSKLNKYVRDLGGKMTPATRTMHAEVLVRKKLPPAKLSKYVRDFGGKNIPPSKLSKYVRDLGGETTPAKLILHAGVRSERKMPPANVPPATCLETSTTDTSIRFMIDVKMMSAKSGAEMVQSVSTPIIHAPPRS